MRISIVLIVLGSQLLACTKSEIKAPTPTAVSKTIKFEIGRLTDYSNPNYNNMQVDIILDISLQDNNNSSYTKLWDTTYSIRTVFDYPLITQPMMLEKTAVNPDPNKKIMKASYNLRFWKDNIIQWQSAAIHPVLSGNDPITIKVNL